MDADRSGLGLTSSALTIGLNPVLGGRILLSMPVRLLRQILSVLLVVAYVSATILAAAPGASAASHPMPGAVKMMMGDAGNTKPMPCSKSMKLDCFNELGCIFMVSLRPADLSVPTAISWSMVTYPALAEFLRGHSIKPALGPPISRA